ncbi:MAG: flagellar hook protein FlgE [Deltaproteobacteria bacterium]|nr:MAG: flagellar hook protein FlgE [Deltaproteobacteria bacterium]TMQ12030.1 MAG: flagellar hook protein FlgE [Deltaproteobacteria bacterium]
MSITNSLYIGISGLQAHGDAISVVGDNIANASTVGYKRDRASFSDMLGGELDAQRLGGGVRLSGTQTMWDQGTVTQTGNPLDLAIRGGGLFMVKGSHGGQTGQYYTRDGRFHLDAQGFVVNPQGLRLQGFAIDAAGTRALSAGDLPLGARQSPPVATANAAMSLNLDANAAVPPPWDPANPNTTSNYATSTTVYDSLGAAHHVEVYFRSQGAGAWEFHAMVDGGELAGGTKGTLTEIANGTLAFNSAGALQQQTVAASSADFVNATPAQVINFTFGDDIASGGTGLAGTTQFAGASSVNGLDIDGRSPGKLTDIVISDDGKIRGVFDNGDKIELAQVALADFANEQGLERTGDGLVTETAASGKPLIDVPGTGARGSVSSGALESSNVDLGNELVTLIAYQRAFQANAKTVTTADEMMNDVNNLKR